MMCMAFSSMPVEVSASSSSSSSFAMRLACSLTCFFVVLLKHQFGLCPSLLLRVHFSALPLLESLCIILLANKASVWLIWRVFEDGYHLLILLFCSLGTRRVFRISKLFNHQSGPVVCVHEARMLKGAPNLRSIITVWTLDADNQVGALRERDGGAAVD